MKINVVLKFYVSTPKKPISNQECKKLEDAVFAFFAPADSIILSTNIRDHLPLANALGKNVISPKNLL